MSDENTNNDEKMQLKEGIEAADNVNAEVDLDDSKAKFINGGVDDTAVDITMPSSDTASFTGLGKDELMKYATDPFWVRLRWILFILFWVGWVAMLAAAIIIIVLAPRCPYKPDLKWYQKGVCYQVRTESFQDSNGDGVGDLNGLKSRLNYFEDLGISTLWLNSIFKSDNVDGNNGVIDYKEIDPTIGTMEDFAALVKAMKSKDMKLIIDFIPNHTSRNHTWFKNSQTDKVGYEDYYIWSDTANNWRDAQGQLAWELDQVKNKYYLHQTVKQFPDLNLRNEKVMKEIEEIMRFWVEKGVFGFNIVGAQYLTENDTLADQASGSSDQTINYPDNVEILSKWRTVLDSLSNKPGREKMLFSVFPASYNLNQTLAYFGDKEMKGLNILPSRVFAELDQTCEADCVARSVNVEMGSVTDWRGWVMGDQDTARAATRFPDSLDRQMRTIQMMLPGTPFVYYGDEIGMGNGDNPASPPNDALRANMGGTIRDIFRTPMQWDNTPTAGFSNRSSYIPLSADHAIKNVATENAHKFTNAYYYLDLFKDLVKLRNEESIMFGKTSTKAENNILYVYRHAEGFPAYFLAVNFGTSPKAISMYAGEDGKLPSKVKVALHSQNIDVGEIFDVSSNLVSISPKTAILFKFEE